MTLPNNHRDKPYMVVQERSLVFGFQGEVIGWAASSRSISVSERFATYEEAVAEAKSMNKSQGLTIYKVNTSCSTFEECTP